MKQQYPLTMLLVKARDVFGATAAAVDEDRTSYAKRVARRALETEHGAEACTRPLWPDYAEYVGELEAVIGEDAYDKLVERRAAELGHNWCGVCAPRIAVGNFSFLLGSSCGCPDVMAKIVMTAAVDYLASQLVGKPVVE